MYLPDITIRFTQLLFAVLVPAACLAASPAPAGVLVSETGSQQFDIFRDDRPIGTHVISWTRQGDLEVVEASTRISIRLLGFEVYRFIYDTRETWDKMGLLQLTASADDDGDRVSVEGRREGDRFVWSDGKMLRSHAMPVYPTNHWNSAVLEQETVLNTITGKINSVTIYDEGMETLAIAESSLPAIRYRYDGQLQLVSWYDPTGRWLAMRFTTEDGSTIRYQCRNCTSPDRS